jgi:ATP-dependent Clp protease ATP-binding subunit ClpB
MKLELTDGAKKLLADEGYDPTLGARPLRRVIQQRLENTLAQRILSGDFKEGDMIRVDVDTAKNDFTFTKSRETVEAELVGT